MFFRPTLENNIFSESSAFKLYLPQTKKILALQTKKLLIFTEYFLKNS